MGCQHQRGYDLPSGTWHLDQQTPLAGRVIGELAISPEEILIQLVSEQWATGPVPVHADLMDNDTPALWMAFEMETALGTSEAVLSLAPDLTRAMIPLGSRDGELELTLALQPGALSSEARRQGEKLAAGLDRWAYAWTDGRFRLEDDDGELVGSIQFLPLDHSLIELYDASMMSPGRVPAQRRDEGPDIILTFDIEPSFKGEMGQLRVNVPTSRAVFPTAHHPNTMDRWLSLVPGLPDEQERNSRLEEASQTAITRERAWLARVGRNLATAATAARAGSSPPACPAPDTMGGDWRQVLADYEVDIEEARQRCIVSLVPSIVQHTRRISARIDSTGILSLEVLGDRTP